MDVEIRNKQAPLSVEWKRNLGRDGLFAILAKTRRGGDPDKEETLFTLTANQAVALGDILVSEGNAKLRDVR